MQDEKAEKFPKNAGNSNTKKYPSKPVRNNEKNKFLWKIRQQEYHSQQRQSRPNQCDRSVKSTNRQVTLQQTSVKGVYAAPIKPILKFGQAKLDVSKTPHQKTFQGNKMLGSKTSQLSSSSQYNSSFNQACENQPNVDLPCHEKNEGKTTFKTSTTCRSFFLQVSSSNPSTAVADEKENRSEKYVNDNVSLDYCSHLPKKPSLNKVPRKQAKERVSRERKNRVDNLLDPRSSVMNGPVLTEESSSILCSNKLNMEKPTVHLTKNKNEGKSGMDPKTSNTRYSSSTEVKDKAKVSSGAPSKRCTTLSKYKLDSKANTATSVIPLRADNFALLKKKYLKTGHNKQLRHLHNPEISYIFKDKMCWRKSFRLRQPRRLVTYHTASDPSEISKNCHRLPKISDLECHISGLNGRPFKKQFQKLCEIIGVGKLDFTVDRNENESKVIRMNNSNDRSKLLTAFECYVEEEGPVRQNFFGGRSNKIITVRSGPVVTKVKYIFKEPKRVNIGHDVLLTPKSWATVLHRRDPFPGGTKRREYGNIIHASKVLCHVF